MFDQNVRASKSQLRAKQIIGLAAVAALTWHGTTHAADVIKANNSDSLNLTSAWVGGVLPSAIDVAVWNSTVASANIVSLGDDATWGGIRIANPGGAVTLNDNTLTIGHLGIDLSAATQNLTINSALTLLEARSQQWIVGAGRTLDVTGAFSRGTGATADFDISSGGIIHISSLPVSTAINYVTLNGGRDFAALDASGNVVSRSTLLAYDPNPSGTTNNANVSGTINNVVDVATSNPGTAPSAFRLSNVANITGGLRFNTPHNEGIAWQVDHPSNRTMTLGGGGLLIGPDVNTDVNFTGNGATSFSNPEGGFIRNYSANNMTFFNNVAGANGIVKGGPGRVIFAGDGNSFAGFAQVQDGTLQIGGGGATGILTTTAGVAITNFGTVEFSRNNALTFGNDITGPGAVSVNMVGAGVLQLTGNNTYSGPTILRGGLLDLLELNDLGSSSQLSFDGGGLRLGPGLSADLTSIGLSTSIGAGGATVDTGGNDVTFANALGGGGAGALTKTGAGVLTLAATNAHTGAINVNGGVLRLSGSGGNGGITVNSGGVLSGTGTSNGLLTVNSGGHVAPGASIGVLNTSALLINSGAFFDFEFSGASNSDRINVTSTDGLTINGGAFNIFADGTTAGFTGEGVYNIFQFAGSVQGSGPGALSINNPQPGFTYAFGTSGNFVTLTIDQVAVTSQWATDASGSWNTGPWTGPVPNGVGSIALFTTNLSTPRTVTLDGGKTVGALIFASDNGYTINPGSGGTIIVENTGGLGNAQLVANSGSHQVNVPLTLNTTTDVNITDAAAVLTLSGNIGGGSALNKIGPGAVVLSGNNSYGGQTTISAGTVEVGSNGALSNSQVSFAANSALRAGGNVTVSNSISIGDAVTASIDSNNNTLTLDGDINDTNGNGVLNKTGSGTVAITGNANHGGSTTISAGALAIGNGGSSGSIGNAPIANNGALVYNRSDDQTVGNVISGSGALVKQGNGVLTLGAANTYTGGTTVNAGTIRSGVDNLPPGATFVTPTGTGTVHLASVSSTLDVADVPTNVGPITGTGLVTGTGGAAVTLTVNVPADATFDGSIQPGSNTLTITKTGAGAWTLTGQSTLNGIYGTGNVGAGGVLALNGPTAQVDATATPLSVSVGSTSIIRVDNGTLNASGTITIQGDGGQFAVTGGLVNIAGDFGIRRSGGTATPDVTQGLQVSGGVLNVGGLVNLSTQNSWGVMVQSGGVVNLTSTAANAFIVNGQQATNVRGGFFRMTGGVLNVASSSGMIIDNVDAQGIAEFQGGQATMEGITVFVPATATAGAATLNVSGTAEIYLGALGINSNYTGLNTAATPISATNVILSGGTIGATADWASSLNMRLDLGDGVTFKAANAANAPFDIELSGVLSGPGGLAKTGGGTVTLSGNNTYTGTTTVNGGRLKVVGTDAANPILTGGGADIQLGRLIFDYAGGSSPQAAVLAALDAGFDQSPKFSEGALRSSTASASTALGWKDDSIAQQLTVAYTYYGDADLNGQVDVADLGILASNWQTAGNWGTADFDYSGFIDVNDLGLLASNWQAGVGSPLGPSFAEALASVGLGSVAVPEPASMGLIGVLASLSLKRPGRRTRR